MRYLARKLLTRLKCCCKPISYLNTGPKPSGEFKRGVSPSFYKQIPLPITKGKGIQGIGLLTLISIGVFSAYPDAEDKEHQPT